jgi:Tfp pilus assembly protein PilN
VSQQINLFNPLFRKPRPAFAMSHVVWVTAAVLAVLLPYYLYLVVHGDSLARQSRELARRIETGTAELGQINRELAQRVKNQALEQEIARTEARVRSRREAMAVLERGELGDTAGFSGYLQAYARQIPEGVWLTGFYIAGAGKEMSLDGGTVRPELVPQYLQRLNREAVMQGRTFATLELRQPKALEAAEKAAPEGSAAPAKAPSPPKPAAYLEFSLSSRTGKDTKQEGGRSQ